MADIRKQVQRFMKECERLLGFAHQNGGLNERECQLLSHYADELTDHVSTICESIVHPAEPQRPTRG
jgi:hypothetical protein